MTGKALVDFATTCAIVSIIFSFVSTEFLRRGNLRVGGMLSRVSGCLLIVATVSFLAGVILDATG